ncbi:MAG: O-antigen ligase family protein [Candidatus Contendobacter sp.]|nr:O-antigen ligase family protein [Candidatus Contendobacter sp.]
MSDLKSDDRAADPGAVLFYGLVALLTFAPLFRAGNRPLPLLVMELVALALLVWRFWAPSPTEQPLSRPARVFLALLFLLPLAQLLPVPLDSWASLPGRAFYAEALRQADAGDADGSGRAVSLIPAATETAWLAMLPPLAVFLATIHLTGQRLLRLVLVFLSIATVQALLGLIQYGDGPNSVFRFGNFSMGDSASGTYISRNHLAGLLEMALPVSLALLMATVGHGRPPHASGGRGRRGRTFRQWLARFNVARINQAAVFGTVAIAILLGLIFTRSRAGVSMAMLGILLCTLMFSHRLGGRNVYGLMGTFTAVGVGLASLIGLAPVWTRFTLEDPLEDGRWKIFDATVQAIGEFFPLGSGAGTFEAVMRRFHPADFPGVTINRAHNDYLEWLLEFGLMAGVLIAAWLLFYARQWGRVWGRGDWTPLRFAQAGAGIALWLMLLHSLADFNLRIPANAVFTAFLAAVFFHCPPEEERRRLVRRRGTSGKSGPLAYPIPAENQANPFAD